MTERHDIIGELHNVKVMIDRDDRAVILATEPPIKFSIDHPYIQGTKLEREARAALGQRRDCCRQYAVGLPFCADCPACRPSTST